MTISPINKAFRGNDNIVRWVTGISARGYLQLLWLDETADIWYCGGRVKLEHFNEAFIAGGQVDLVPAPGQTYRRCGAMGTVTEYARAHDGATTNLDKLA